MSVPEKLMSNAHVFCYSPDLLEASEKLAEYLNCSVSKVYEWKWGPGVESATVAWLVGHGNKSNTIVGNDDGSFGYRIRDISEWLKTEGRDYKYLVDTCCYPNRRKSSQTFGHDYYCTNDNECVLVITSYPSFDGWWDASHMHQY